MENFAETVGQSTISLGQAIEERFKCIQNIINENSEIISNIHSKLDSVLFEHNANPSGVKCDEAKLSSDNIWGDFDDTEELLRVQNGRIMGIYERLEK